MLDNVDMHSNTKNCTAMVSAVRLHMRAACDGLQMGASHALGDRSEADRLTEKTEALPQ